jgi:hypothetical protein
MATNSQFYITRDFQGEYTSGSKMCHSFSNDIEWLSLVAGTVQSFTVPGLKTDYVVLEFSYSNGTNVLVQPSASPTLAEPVTSPLAVPFELNPAMRQVRGGTTIQLLALGADALVTISMMQTVYGV